MPLLLLLLFAATAAVATAALRGFKTILALEVRSAPRPIPYLEGQGFRFCLVRRL